MDEVSNKTLATLLVVAIVISLAGTFFAMRGVSQITNVITGFDVAPSGTAKVNISELTSIALTNNTVDFGAGYRNASVVSINEECNLTTLDQDGEGTDVIGENNCWINLSDYSPLRFRLENDGSNYVNITINSSNADNFINGTILGAGSRRYQFAPADSSEGIGAVFAENGCNVTFTPTGVWTEFSEVPQLLCTNMSPFDGEDEFAVDINISIPAGPLGQKTAVVTFYAVKSAQ